MRIGKDRIGLRGGAPQFDRAATCLRLLREGDEVLLGQGIEMLAHRHRGDAERARQSLGTLRPEALQPPEDLEPRRRQSSDRGLSALHSTFLKHLLDKFKGGRIIC